MRQIFLFGIFAATLGFQNAYACTLTSGTPEEQIVLAVESEDIVCLREMARQVIDINASVSTPRDARNNWSHSLTALGYAARLGKLIAIRTLLSAGARIDAQDRYGMSAVAVAASYHQPLAVRLLASQGAPLNYNACAYGLGSRECLSPLTTALVQAQGAYDTAEELLRAGADPDLQANGTLPLALATQDFRLIDLLVTYGVDPNSQTSSGSSALNFCFTADCVDKLVTIGADVNSENAGGCTALDYASKTSTDVADALVNHGARKGANCRM